MDDFEFSFSLFDPNIIPSVAILTFSLFCLSFIITRGATIIFRKLEEANGRTKPKHKRRR
jgi:hypothetical protein